MNSLWSLPKSEIESDLIGKCEPVLASLSYGLRDLEVLGNENSPLVRVTLDSLNPSHQIGVEDCQKAHEVLGPLFDLWDPFPGAYTLEVSSPGESPCLRNLEHFAAALGSRIKFQTLEPVPMPPPAKARRNWDGLLVSLVEGEIPLLKIEDQFGLHEIALNKIKSAQWMRDWAPVKTKPSHKDSRKPSNRS